VPVEYSLVQAPFRLGVDEGTDPKQVPFGKLLVARNLVWLKSGRLEKRCGITALSMLISGGGSVGEAIRLMVRGTELCLTAGETLYSYQSTGWIDRGKLPEVGLTWTTMESGLSSAKSADVAYLSNGHVVEAWVAGDPQDALTAAEKRGLIYYQIRDLATGSFIVAPTNLPTVSASATIRVIASGTTWVILFIQGGRLRAYTSTGVTDLRTDASDDGTTAETALDAYVQGPDFVVAYTLLAGGIRLVRASLATTPVVAAHDVVSGDTSVDIQALAVAGAAGEVVYVGYMKNTGGISGNVVLTISNASTMATVVAGSIIVTSDPFGSAHIGIARETSTTAILTYSRITGSANDSERLMGTFRVTSAGGNTNLGRCESLMLLSKPFQQNGRFYAYARQSVNVVEPLDSFLVDVINEDDGPFREVGKVDWLIAGLFQAGYVSAPSVVSATRTIAAVPYISSVLARDTGTQGIRLVNALTGADLPKDMWRSITLGEEAYWPAGVYTSYDGLEALGYGFPHGPTINEDTTVGSAAGGTLPAGSHSYNVTAERQSAVGVLHRSPIGTPYGANTVGASGSVTVGLNIPDFGRSVNIPTRALFPLYRDEVPATDGLLHRLTDAPDYMAVFDVNLTYPTIVNTDLPATLGVRPYMYTEGGELEDVQPPSVLSHAVYRNRVFALLGDKRTVVFTKNATSVPGIAPGFNPAMRMLFTEDIVALSTMDERVFFFWEDGIFYTSGDGPALNGEGSDYSEPNKVQTDVGCSNPRGVVSTPAGIMFVHDNEIHLLNRGMAVEWIGKPLQDLLDLYPNVTSAVLVAKKNQVRFSFVNDDASEGIVAVFDYVEGQWSHFVYGDSLPIADAVMWDGVYTFVTPAGQVYVEDNTTWRDDGEWVTASIETAWVHAAGPLAYHAVRAFRLDGVSAGDHQLLVSVGFNGNTTYQQGPKTFAAGVSGVTAPGPIETADVTIGTRRKCRSIRFKVEDAEGGTNVAGRSVQWSTMGIEVGVEKGFGRLAARQKG
jgi:hypothetical protein